VNTTRIMAVAALIVASALAPHVARAQAPGIKRTDLQRHDLSVPGREVIQVLVDMQDAASIFPHDKDRPERCAVRYGGCAWSLGGLVVRTATM
jgi:hypothetical protein